MKLRSADAWEIARYRFGLVGIKMVVIDECHHFLRSGPGRDVLAAIQSLKHIMQSDPGVALVIAGVPTLRDAIMLEPSGETYRRFMEYHLSKICLGTNSAKLFGANFSKSADKLGLQVHSEDAFAERILFAECGQVGRCVKLGKEILRDASGNSCHLCGIMRLGVAGVGLQVSQGPVFYSADRFRPRPGARYT
ncbi:TniB family NTP-binding protein [Octadecabacter antarcticus]|uniref:TniB family NTP-binding protein n=1 Tax=Octadecabacter antarcticus TaxID=1217908 RepID=UPI001650FCE0